MFQPQDQIEVEDGFKQYDGKPGFLMEGFVCLSVYVSMFVCGMCVFSPIVTFVLICNLHAKYPNMIP